MTRLPASLACSAMVGRAEEIHHRGSEAQRKRLRQKEFQPPELWRGLSCAFCGTRVIRGAKNSTVVEIVSVNG